MVTPPKCSCGICRLCITRAGKRAWKKTPKGRIANRKHRRTYYRKNREDQIRKASEWSKANPDKRRAYNLVANAIRYGRLFKQPCERCGTDKAQAHHEDYMQPLNIKWLCSSCHISLHVQAGGSR